MKKNEAVAMKINTIMWWMIKNLKMVTHEVLSPYGIHLSVYNCIYRVTPSEYSAGKGYNNSNSK